MHELELLGEWCDAIELCLVHEPPDPTVRLGQVDLLGAQIVEDMSEQSGIPVNKYSSLTVYETAYSAA